jgi:hypothetical protein
MPIFTNRSLSQAVSGGPSYSQQKNVSPSKKQNLKSPGDNALYMEKWNDEELCNLILTLIHQTVYLMKAI